MSNMVLQKEPPKTPSTTDPTITPETLAPDSAYYRPPAPRSEDSPVRYIDIGNSLEAETGEEVHQAGTGEEVHPAGPGEEVHQARPGEEVQQAAPGSNHRERSTNYRFEMRSSKPSAHRDQDAYPQLGGTEATGLPSDDDDAYRELRYDPDRRSKLRASERTSPPLRAEHHPGPSRGSEGEEVVIKGGYRYLLTTSPSLSPGPPSTAQEEASGPYHLHPQGSPASGGVRGNPDAPEVSQTLGGRDGAVQWESGSRKPPKCTSTLKSPRPVNRNLDRTRGDIVERNKLTLGRKATQGGSYLRAHAPKQEADDLARWEDPREEEEEEEEEEEKDEVTLHGAEGFDQDLRWLQKTQQLKALRSSRRDCPPQEGIAGPRPHRPGAAADRPGPRHRRPPGGGSGGGMVARREAQKDVSLKGMPHEALPPISSSVDSSYDSQAAVTSPSPSGHGWDSAGLSSPAPDSSVGYYLDVRAPRRPRCGGGFQNALIRVGRAPRAQAPQWPPSYDPEHFLIQDEDEGDLRPQDDFGGAGVQLWRSGSHLVLPPIAADGRGRGAEAARRSGSLSPARRSSEPACVSGYLAQMERQRQLKEGAGYKVYTLKDYRQLNHVVNLCGLGPDKANEKTAEKTRRRRLYSNGIRERNRKTSPAPLPPPRDTEDADKTPPRRKALDYAKSIAKPRPKPHPRKTQDQSEGGPGPLGAAHLEGVDLSQLKALEDMRRRHEEEKRTVASFRKAHVL